MTVIELADRYLKLCISSDTNVPHRVIFHPPRSGVVSSRVFPTLQLASDFADSKYVGRLILIQPASESPPDIKKPNPFTRHITKTVPCEKCNGKNKRLTSQPMCSDCSGLAQDKIRVEHLTGNPAGDGERFR